MSNSPYHELTLRDGRTLAYSEYGNPSGLPIICCHGVPSSRVEGDLIINDATASALGLRVIVPDRPGVGRSQAQPGRRIVDWPNDVIDLAAALGLGAFAVLGSSGGAPYAAACGALIPDRARVVGVLGGMAPPDAPGFQSAMSGPLRMMFRLARSAPALLRLLLGLNLRAARRGGERGNERMAAWAPEPDPMRLANCIQRARRDWIRPRDQLRASADASRMSARICRLRSQTSSIGRSSRIRRDGTRVLLHSKQRCERRELASPQTRDSRSWVPRSRWARSYFSRHLSRSTLEACAAC